MSRYTTVKDYLDDQSQENAVFRLGVLDTTRGEVIAYIKPGRTEDRAAIAAKVVDALNAASGATQ